MWETRWWNQAGHAKYDLAFSCGVATYHKGMDIKEVLDLADRDMYRAKREKQASSAATTDAWLEQADERTTGVRASDEVH